MRAARVGGVVPVSWCTEHGDKANPVMAGHPGGGLHCAALAQGRRRAETEAGAAR
ncbi:hypothetical protein [Streptomyces sp. NPDC097981]|uniref:hypothetical protein n=1 Tax=Streptomyces sp. NPDC097981 TaxID=3155428 RepID=UPI003319E1FA